MASLAREIELDQKKYLYLEHVFLGFRQMKLFQDIFISNIRNTAQNYEAVLENPHISNFIYEEGGTAFLPFSGKPKAWQSVYRPGYLAGPTRENKPGYQDK